MIYFVVGIMKKQQTHVEAKLYKYRIRKKIDLPLLLFFCHFRSFWMLIAQRQKLILD